MSYPFVRRMCYNCGFAQIFVIKSKEHSENELKIYCGKEISRTETWDTNFCKDYTSMGKRKNTYLNFAGERYPEGVCDEIDKIEKSFEKIDR